MYQKFIQNMQINRGKHSLALFFPLTLVMITAALHKS